MIHSQLSLKEIIRLEKPKFDGLTTICTTAPVEGCSNVPLISTPCANLIGQDMVTFKLQRDLGLGVLHSCFFSTKTLFKKVATSAVRAQSAVHSEQVAIGIMA